MRGQIILGLLSFWTLVTFTFCLFSGGGEEEFPVATANVVPVVIGHLSIFSTALEHLCTLSIPRLSIKFSNERFVFFLTPIASLFSSSLEITTTSACLVGDGE